MRWWQVLGVPRSADRDAVRRAYARLLKSTNPEDDPEGFMALRAAYDDALSGLKWREKNGDAEGFQPLVLESAEADAPPALDTPPVREAAAPEPPEPDPEAIARAAAFADLEDRQRVLVATLEGRSPKAELLAAFDAVMAAPIVEEIDVRAGIELWLAMVIADFRGASDPLVMPAIQRFGWDHAVAGRQHPAVADVVRRRAEGELVNQMSRPHAPLHVGFEALRKPPGAAWRMRATALLTSAPDDVRRLLAMIDTEMPGLADWLDADAIAWWRDWLGSPRQSTETLALAPLGMIAVLLIVAVGNLPAWAGWLGSALCLGLPIAAQRLVLAPQWRLLNEPWTVPLWAWWGWMPALLALFPVAGVLPESGWSALLLALLAVLVLGWATIATPLPNAPGLAARARAIFGAVWPFGVLAITAARMNSDVHALMWAIVSLAVAIAWWRGSEALADPLRQRLGQWGLPAMVAVAGLLLGLGWIMKGDDRYRLMLAVTAAMLALYVASRMTTPDLWRWLLLIGWVGLALTLVQAIEQHVVDDGPPSRRAQEGTLAPASPGIGSLTRKALGLEEPARPIGSQADWVRASDYPPGAFPGPGEHKVVVMIALSTAGRVLVCSPAEGTLPQLAGPTCKALRQRARFTPARDAKGKVVPSVELWKIEWRVPEPVAAPAPPPAALPAPPLRQVNCPADTRSAPPGTALPAVPCDQPSWFQDGDYPRAAAQAGEQGTVAYELQVDAQGGVADCRATTSSGSARLDEGTCKILLARARFLPARDEKGQPKGTTITGRMTWRLQP